MSRLRRLLVLFAMCLALIDMPMWTGDACCAEEAAEHTEPCVDAADPCDDTSADLCTSWCGCCRQAPIPADGITLARPGFHLMADTPATERGPPARDPDELLQVPIAA